MAGGGALYLEAGVWWDMNTCPVPAGFDPRRVRRCIESAVEKKLGGHCAVNIYGFGNLEYIPRDLLEMISSTGIILIHGLRNMMDFNGYLEDWADSDIETTYTMVITDDYVIAYPPLLGLYEFTKFCAYPKDGRLIALSNQTNPTHKVLPCDFVWETLVSDNYPDTDEMNSTGRNAIYTCNICHTYFEEEFSTHLKFSTHLQSEQHRTKLFDIAARDPSNGELKLFCKLCNYPADVDYNLLLHNESEEHKKKAQEEDTIAESRKRGPVWDPVGETNKKQSLERAKQ